METARNRDISKIRSEVKARISVCLELCSKINAHAENIKSISQRNLENLKNLK